MTEVHCRPGGTSKFTRDAVANDSDKSFTVPAGKKWNFYLADCILATTATVGNRKLVMIVTDGTNQIGYYSANSAVTANGTHYHHFGSGMSRNTSGPVDYPIPSNGLWLGPGYVIRIYDEAAIDAAADDLTVVLHYIEYEA